MASIHHLGDDVLLMCHALLPLRAILCCRLVNRRWLVAASHDDIWQALCTKHVPAAALLPVNRNMQLFGKLHKKPATSTTPPPTDLSDIYLVLTLTLGRKTKDGFLDEDDEYHEDEYEYEDIPLMLQLAEALPRGDGNSQRELELDLPSSCEGADEHSIRSRAFLWDARNELVSSLPGESTNYFSVPPIQETPIMQRVMCDTRDSRAYVMDGPNERGNHLETYLSEGPTFRARLRFAAAVANAHSLLELPDTYLDVTFEGCDDQEGALCCLRLGRPDTLDHIFCALPIIDGLSVAQPRLLEALALLEWR